VVEIRKGCQDGFDRERKSSHRLFWKIVGAADDGDEAEIVDIDDVAGVVPAIGEVRERRIVGADNRASHLDPLQGGGRPFDSLRHEPV
jgi:hypothetical protein